MTQHIALTEDPLLGDPDELQRRAKEYLAEAQKTTDLILRDELLKLCEQVLREATAARQATSVYGPEPDIWKG